MTINFKREESKVKIEVWDTRYGTSVRVVARRTDGKFVNNKSERQVVKVVFDLDDKGEYRRPVKTKRK